MKLLITGGAGFIGSNFVHYALREHDDWQTVNLDKLTYAGNRSNLEDIENDPRYRFVKGDIVDRELVSSILKEDCDLVINFAAESHVDRSITDSFPFIETNVKGTQVLLEAARQCQGVKRFIQVSTDEVYGSLDEGAKFTEASIILPSSPYAASKAAADLLCHAYYRTYGFPVIIGRCCNNYGPYQFPEKLIPLAIANALESKEIPIYGDGLNVRDWIHVEDHCRALGLIIQKGKPGETYNIGANTEKTNLELVYKLLDIIGKPRSLVTFVADRPAHDRRYALDTTKITQELVWKPLYPFDKGLEDTVNWYIEHEPWWKHIRNGDYLKYYQDMYSSR
jgi:dTDP-glucose 4,6-dehydratase